jgi:hypothetical protein
MPSAGLFAHFVVQNLARLFSSPSPLAIFVVRGAPRNDAQSGAWSNDEMTEGSGRRRERDPFGTC